MRYKDVLVYIDDGDSNAERVSAALSIAKSNGARLTGVVINATPPVKVLIQQGIERVNQVIEQCSMAARRIAAEFESAAKGADIDHRTRVIDCNAGSAARELAQLARCFDLCILRQANPDRSNARLILDVAEEVLFSSGRPVLFMPYIGAHRIPCRRAVVAWDGSAAATRALHDALPLLENMEEVIVLMVDANRRKRIDEGKPGEDISRHLDAHGLRHRVECVVSGGAPASVIILNELFDLGADIVIMGGYGTPRLREVVLGGVTRTVMGSMTVPVFMSH